MSSNHLKIGTAGFAGAMFLVCADIGLKGQAGAIKVIRDNAAQFFLGAEHLLLVGSLTVVVVIAFGTVMCFIFEESTMQRAFFRGASVLAIGMTLVPNPQIPPVRHGGNSELVQINLETEDGKTVRQAVLTLWDSSTNRVVARSSFAGNSFSFYQAPGKYRLSVEVPGHNIESRNFEVKDSVTPPPLMIPLRSASVPVFIQRIFR